MVPFLTGRNTEPNTKAQIRQELANNLRFALLYEDGAQKDIGKVNSTRTLLAAFSPRP
jgi:hypothetical protein